MKRWLRIFTAIGLAAPAGSSLASPPGIGSVLPRGAMRGEEALIMIQGERLGNPLELTWYDDGIETVRVNAVSDQGDKVAAHVRIRTDCRVGEHVFRLRTAAGFSPIRTFYVGPFPSVTEHEPNNEFNRPQVVAANWTIAGRVENEDVDYDRVHAAKGETLSAEIEAMRLGGAMFDPYLALLDSNRFELAVSDDSPLLAQDGFVSVVAPEDGEYSIEVRETAYRGGGDHLYRLHIGNFPRPTAVYPPGGPAGETIEVRFIPAVGESFARTVTLPSEPGMHTVLPEGPLPPPSPNPIRVRPYGNVLEAEPNNAWTSATPHEAEAPIAFNGIIESEGDVDWFSFQARKGQNLKAMVFARRIRSPLDPVMVIKDPAGKNIQNNDDAHGLDSGVQFSPPEDGRYTVHVRDKLSKGGKNFVYRLEVFPVEPSLSLNLPTFDNGNPQHRQTVVVCRGNRFALPFIINRSDMSGPVAISAEGLPQGVTLESPLVDFGSPQVPVMFHAAADAPLAGALVDLVGTHQHEGEPLIGHYRQSVGLVLGSPNNHVWYSVEADRLAVAVAEESPFTLSIASPDIPLIQGGGADLKVTAERHNDFSGDIKCTLLYKPDGISGNSAVMMSGGATEITYRLNGDGNAAPRTYPLAVVGHSGGYWVSTPFTDVEVISPFLGGAIDMAAIEQGKEGEVVCRLNHLNAFEGEASVTLHGLPPNTSSEPITITATNELAVFPVRVEADAPTGKHKQLYCMVNIPHGEHFIANSAGAFGTLRVDPPRVEKPDPEPEPEPEPVVEAEPPKPDVRLSRLDQLRKEKAARDDAVAMGDSS